MSCAPPSGIPDTVDQSPDPDATPTDGRGSQEPGYATPGGGSIRPLAEGGPYANTGGSYTVGSSGNSTTSDINSSFSSQPGDCTRIDLGKISERYESNGNPGAIGRDRTGGWSYGTYQIATKTGTFLNYMNFLKTRFTDFYNELEAVGGEPAARSGSAAFKEKWEELAASGDEFRKSQHDFIQVTHHDPAVQSIKREFGLDVCNDCCNGVQDMIWSASVQHGPAGCVKILRNALRNTKSDIKKLTDRQLIEIFYNERSKVDVYFSRSTAAVKQSVYKRFQTEKTDAIAICQERKPAPTPPAITGESGPQ